MRTSLVTVRLMRMVKTSPSLSSKPTMSTSKGRYQEFDGGEFVGIHDPEVLPMLFALQVLPSLY